MKRVFVFISCLPLIFCWSGFKLSAQSAKEVLERTWYGVGQFSANILEGGYGYTKYMLYSVKVNDDNSFTGILVETFELEGRKYQRTTDISGMAYPSENRVNFWDTNTRSKDYLPSPFTWGHNNFKLKLGRFNDRPNNLGMEGSNKSESNYIKVQFLDSPD